VSPKRSREARNGRELNVPPLFGSQRAIVVPSLTSFLHQGLEGVSYRGVITHDKRRTNPEKFVN
jgi:hypothetical protein